MLTFDAAPPAGLTLTNVLLDLYSSPDIGTHISILRQECERVLDRHDTTTWTRDAVDSLHLLDSTIRESMRISNFGSHAFPCRVSNSTHMTIRHPVLVTH